ncbi:hypothetical protein AB0K60_24375 [Thermopolyspora sp. NPDC052614]|uniref:hypothetical protein n=1 Tax=Thermopolyspora sp. NPDC052614 TaxID=3155682 RepID=UPI0034328FEE
MGRHRTDPIGATRLLLAGLAILAVLGLISVGVWSLIGSLTPDDASAGLSTAEDATQSPEANSPGADSSKDAPDEADATATGSASPAEEDENPQASGAPVPPGSIPTVYLECLAEICPVFLRIPGGDVLIDRDLTRGEKATYFEPRIDVVLGDAATVRVFVNGEERKRGEEGERQTFTASRPTPTPS